MFYVHRILVITILARIARGIASFCRKYEINIRLLGYPVRVHPRMQIDYFQTRQRGEFQEKKKRKLIHYVLPIDAVFAIISRFIIDIH